MSPRKTGSGQASSSQGAGMQQDAPSVNVEARRQALIATRRDELRQVEDKHDDLVRELFQLERFKLLTGYDPKKAKTDNSPVFEQYKTPYNLMRHVASSAGPSRRTRRGQIELANSLSIASGPTIQSAPVKARKSKETPQAGVDMWSIVAGAKAKAKGQEHPSESISADGRPNGQVTASLSGSAHVHPMASTVRVKRPIIPISDTSPPRKRVKSIMSRPSASGPSESISTHARRSGRLRAPSPSVVSTLSGSSSRPALVNTTRAVKPYGRIKLIVRPPLSVSHPAHLPRKPKYGGGRDGTSLSSLLSSHTLLDDDDLTDTELERMARKDAAVYIQFDDMRREGRGDVLRMRLDHPTLPTSVASTVPNDTWTEVVRAMEQRSSVHARRGQDIASVIAGKVRAYWEGQAAKEDRARIAEEKRLRALAKATMKLVTNEWKKIVFHLRDQERAQAEQEERRRGHEHLDAILDQSGQILSAQQVDLGRDRDTRSRSLSWAASVGDSDDESDLVSGDGSSNRDETGDETSSDVDEGHLGSSDVDDTSTTTTMHETGELLMHDLAVDIPPGEPPPTPRLNSFSPTAVPALSDSGSSPPMHVTTTPTMLSRDLAYHEEPSASATLEPDPPVIEAFNPSDPLVFPSIEKAPPNLPLEAAEDLDYHLLRPPDENQISTVPNERAATTEAISTLTVSEQETSRSVEASASVSTQMIADTSNAENVPNIQQVNSDIFSDGSADEDGPNYEPVPTRGPHDDLPEYLRSYAVAPVQWDVESKIRPPVLLRGTLRPYQQYGLEWLASLHTGSTNGILADEMGLGKTIQTIALLGHLACDRGIWGPHLIVVPTSVLLNWEMEFKKFLPGFKIVSYHGNVKRRKELRQGWSNKYHFNVCITSYALATRDAHIFRRKPWYYMILDEAHMIKNFKSQRWNTLLMFRSFRRLLLTGTPLQNNLTELWALLQFLLSGHLSAELKQFTDWFSNPLEKAVEMGMDQGLDEENQRRVTQLHTLLRPHLLRRLKRDVEKELPSKHEHLVTCALSKRQRFLYDEFMLRRETRADLSSGVYMKVANILMQLRKVCNHPDLFEVRPIVTSFAMSRSAAADFEIKELLVRRRWLEAEKEGVNLGFLGLRFVGHDCHSGIAALETRRLDATHRLVTTLERLPLAPPEDYRTIEGYRRWKDHQARQAIEARQQHTIYLNRIRCSYLPVVFRETIDTLSRLYRPLLPKSASGYRDWDHVNTTHALIRSVVEREEAMSNVLDRFAFVTPRVVALGLPRIALSGRDEEIHQALGANDEFDAVLHRAQVKLQIAFPDPSLLQYDCGKLQVLERLLRERKAGGHRVLLFTQMARILDILEIFLNLHGWLYLRLDGATKIEDRQYITERFNSDARIFCFISSSRSGGVGINLTGADTVIFYDSDFNPQMDRQCEDRAHRIGQIRDVHIYRFVSQYTVEEALLRKANQKRHLDDLVIQQGQFDWRTLFKDENALDKALGAFEDQEDAHAAVVAAKEATMLEGVDVDDFADMSMENHAAPATETVNMTATDEAPDQADVHEGADDTVVDADEEEEGGTVVEYMLNIVKADWPFFTDWKI